MIHLWCPGRDWEGPHVISLEELTFGVHWHPGGGGDCSHAPGIWGQGHQSLRYRRYSTPYLQADSFYFDKENEIFLQGS